MSLALTPEDRVQDLVELIVDAFDLDADVEVESEGDEIRVEVVGDGVDAFVGKDGVVIDAIQHLAYKVAGTGRSAGPRVIVDAGGYRAKRREHLERQADQAAERALADHRSVELEPMNAIERKVVHEYLRERGDVETWSEGAEPERRLVVAPRGS